MSPRHRPCEHCRRQHLKCEGCPTCTRCKDSTRECRGVEPEWRFHHTVPAALEESTQKLTGSRARPRNDHGAAGASPPIASPPISASAEAPHEQRTSRQCLSLQDACLLRHFMEDLSRWFDLTDPENHFATIIPKLTRESSTLLDAILAVSARHFSTLPSDARAEILRVYGVSQTEVSITEETVIHYHSRCIAELRVLSDIPDAVMDENLLAAVVVLRFFEELDNPFTSPPTETALRGLHVFLQAQASSALAIQSISSSSTPIRRAAFWVGFRQEFNLAFAQQRTVSLPFETFVGHVNFSPVPDHGWTNRLVVLGARVLEFCYGSQLHQGIDEYSELQQLRNEWTSERPWSFTPVYAEEASRSTGSSSDIFPRIWFMDDCYIAGAQTLCLLDILLTAYSPSISRPGIGLGQSREQKQDLEAADAKIRHLVLDICGMTLSKQQCRPAGLTACIAINLCADRFTDRNEQRALTDLVVRTTKESNHWPTGESEKRLRVQWGWD